MIEIDWSPAFSRGVYLRTCELEWRKNAEFVADRIIGSLNDCDRQRPCGRAARPQ
jgi:hypothetical protein